MYFMLLLHSTSLKTFLFAAPGVKRTAAQSSLTPLSLTKLGSPKFQKIFSPNEVEFAEHQRKLLPSPRSPEVKYSSFKITPSGPFDKPKLKNYSTINI
jgi:hypothetical protein